MVSSYFLYVVPGVVLVPSHWNVQCQHPHRLLFHDFVIQIKNDYMVLKNLKKKEEKKKDILDGTLFLHVVPCVFLVPLHRNSVNILIGSFSMIW